MNKAQKNRAKIPIYLFSVLLIAVCILRFFQLLNYTDSENGYSLNSNMSAMLYIGVAIIGAVAGFYSKHRSKTAKLFEFDEGYKGYFLSAVFLSVTFFVDFIHQCFNSYFYISKTAYIELVYLIPLGLSALLSLVCSFYFVLFSSTARGSNYDFRSFKYLHFAPVGWCFLKLIMIMVKLVDIRFNVDASLEFLLISFALMLLLCFVSSIDNQGNTSRLMVFSAMMTITLSAVISIPRMLVIIFGGVEKLLNVSYTGLTYFAVGIFSLVLLCKCLKNNDGD